MNKLIKSSDGSHTLFVPNLDEHYHSVHGAVAESMHVFINAGMSYVNKSGNFDDLKILEIGFGTGLNAFLTYVNSDDKLIFYHTIEKYPISLSDISQLNYKDLFESKYSDVFKLLHSSVWDEPVNISSDFVLHKSCSDFREAIFLGNYNLVYFDAFAPDKQPKLWNEALFQNIFNSMCSGGVLVTYCAKGVVRRMLQNIGFKVERIPGPPPKREMIRAVKP